MVCEPFSLSKLNKREQFTADRFSCLKCAHSIHVENEANSNIRYSGGGGCITDYFMHSKVYNVDCLEAMKATPDNFYSLAIVDPPYGIGRSGHALSISADKSKQWHKFFEDKKWDSTIPEAEYFAELQRVSVNQIIWGGNYFTDFLRPSRGWVFWYKEQNGLSMSDGEMAWTSFDQVARQYSLHRTHLWQEGTIHPTQKPVALYKWLLQNYAKQGDTILDTHLGSGSSRIAAYDLGFDFVGYELDREYWLAQEERFAQHIAQPKLFLPTPIMVTQDQLFVTI